ncbi:CDP-glycerol--poly(glycerophosphate) glycerophosphotransferase [Methanobacterium paludis]|uniref:CDP-glycerol:poly(Glycerophosphate) glycerophosphotransferase n=1 Tax=Methanobacterium paludis (strain DSM 25820 / JCM 18151 / SWAN1) TaxID=868131 RepID=F6D710_METPW|nr:CDP-glycerol--poly(glycerophosphate) glycerophosphotransferase [Methanobacterium paludis]AEG18377.1 CDP-glycerol:poly(glycerophosphate) glycerophosphotransferase [Methanobacterium paludis]
MDKALILLEPNQGARRGFLVTLEKLIRSFELKILKYRLKRIIRNLNGTICSQDSNESRYLNKNGIKTSLVGNIQFSQDQLEKSKKFSKYVAKNWYNQSSLHLLDFEGINLGKATEQETMELIDQLFKKFLNYKSIIEKNVVNTVYIENPYSPDGKAIKLICEDLGLDCIPLYPSFYGKLKTWFINKLKYRTYKKTGIDPINVYSTQTASKFQSDIKILMDVPYPNHLDVVYPTIQKFISKGYKIFLLAKSNDIKKYKSFLNIKIKKVQYKDLNKKLNKYFSYLRKNHYNIFKYENVDLWKLIEDDLYYSHKNKLPALLYHLKNFLKVVETIKPNLVIVGDDRAPSSVRIDILYCKKRGIPHFEVQHGIYTTNSLLATPLSDKIFVWGEATKNALVEAGANNDQIEVTGSPKYDSVITKLNDYSKSITNPLNKTILFATQPFPGNINLQIIDEIGLFLKKNEGINLIVKPHPAETADYYKKFVEHFADDMIHVADNNDNIIELLLNADVTIMISSTVGIDAAILDKPMICVNLSDQKSVYVEGGVALEAKDLKDIVSQINNIMYDDKIRKNLAECRKRFVYNYVYLQDGKASERIVDGIVKMIESKDDH